MLNKTYTNVRNFSLILLTTIFVLVILKNLNIVNANSEILISENETAITSTGSSNSHAWKPVLQVNSTDFANIHYIDNAHYFIVNPLHNENVGNDNENGACTTVAMQLLMGYHNYYSDRRLIPVFNEDGDRYLSENYGNLAEHPKVNRVDNSGLGKESIGTEDLFFDKLMALNSISTNPLIGQAMPLVANAARSFIENYSSDINDEVNINFYINDVISRAKSEIDAGRPTILAGTLEIVDGKFSSHVVVAYGYANYQGEEGFIVHSGWRGDSANVWYPASWFGYQITMNVDHAHSFVDDFDVYDNAYRKLKCTTCDCVDLDYIYDISSDGTSIIGTNYDLTGSITIPEVISGKNICSIGENAFKNQIGISNVVINDNITSIGSNSFEGCSSLVDIFIDCSSPILIGSNVFDSCNENLKINVDQYDYWCFSSSSNWENYIHLVHPNKEFIDIVLDCSMDDKVLVKDISSGLIRITVLCSKGYKFVSNDNVLMTIFNERMESKRTDDNIPLYMFEVGIYYFEVKPNSDEINGEITINYGLESSLTAQLFNMEEQLNLNNYFHDIYENKKHGILFFTNNQGSGLYKLKLDCGNSYSYNNVKIKVYTDFENDELLNRYDTANANQVAINNENENELFLYLKENCIYYVFIEYDKSNSFNAIFSVESVEEIVYDYSNSLLSSGLKIIFEDVKKVSYFEKVTFSHDVKIEMDVYTNISLNSLGWVYIFKEVKEPTNTYGEYNYSLETIYASQIGSPDWLAVFTLMLESGTYYFGYDNNLNKTNVNFAFNRIVNHDECSGDVLVTDPTINQGYVLGTEVLFNNGLYGATTITEGFTRNIYLMVEDRVHDPMSRLDYSWYSSDESKAMVTSYGTVLALPVEEDSTVTIYAIRKSDPSVIYYETFTILNDTEEDLIEIECNLSYSYSKKNGTYQLALNSTNCPYPMIQYYTWEVTDSGSETVTIGNWGHVTSTGITEALIVGTYELNPRVRLCINLNITE